MGYKPYEKVLTTNDYYGVCAIYEPHPFRNSAIKDAIEQSGYTCNADIGINDDEWCWVFYDWSGNPIGWSNKKPEGETVEKFTKEKFYSNASLAEYLNEEPSLRE